MSLQPLNLEAAFAAVAGPAPLFASHLSADFLPPPLFIPPMPASAPALLPAAEQVAPWEDDALEGAALEGDPHYQEEDPLDEDPLHQDILDEDWSTVYQEGPDHPPYTLEDIPGVVINLIAEAKVFLQIVRSADISNMRKNTVYYALKTVLYKLLPLEDMEADMHVLTHEMSLFEHETRALLTAQFENVGEAIVGFLEWMPQYLGANGMDNHALLPFIYHHYVRAELRPSVAVVEEQGQQEGEPQGGEPQEGEPQGGEPQGGEPQGGEEQAGEPWEWPQGENLWPQGEEQVLWPQGDEQDLWNENEQDVDNEFQGQGA
jgi:hypothetical protein